MHTPFDLLFCKSDFSLAVFCVRFVSENSSFYAQFGVLTEKLLIKWVHWAGMALIHVNWEIATQALGSKGGFASRQLVG